MRRPLIIGALVALAIAAVVLLIGRGGGDEKYLVRAIFDNGAFLVKGEEVRVAGANVGKIDSVGVTMPDEYATYEDDEPKPEPGKAVIVLDITDPGFQDFRRDASCLIRPQSLIGEKFIDCRPTLPRAPGSEEEPAALEQLPDGQPGAGQYLLPVENNSTSVDPDLINDIQTLPYAQRFRLILNELGAGLAARGEDIEEVVKRANPVLRDTDRLFGILSEQRDQLAQLTADSDAILRPLARDRTSVSGFFSNSGAAAEASAERGEELEESFAKLPAFLREFRSTMRSLKTFSDAAAPVFSNFDEANPAFTEATQALTPFSAASTVALKSLGATGEVVGPKLVEADPIVVKSRDLATSGASPTTKLAQFFVSTNKTKGWDGLVDLIYNGTGATNEYDRYGHFVRSLVTLTNCTDYVTEPQSGCDADFTGATAAISSIFDPAEFYARLREELAKQSGGTSPEAFPNGGALAPASPSTPIAPATPAVPQLGEGEQLGESQEGEALGTSGRLTSPAQRALLNYLLGP